MESTEIQKKFKNFNVKDSNNFMKDLMNEYALKVNDVIYFLEEIEMYYHSNTHPDKCVINRNMRACEFFFHGYGFDICFDTETKEDSYGGILVRSLWKYDENILDSYLIHGPFNCMIEILRNIDSTNKLQLCLIKKPKNSEHYDIYALIRKIGKCDENDEFNECEYRFLTTRILRNENTFSQQYRKASLISTHIQEDINDIPEISVKRPLVF